MTEYQSVYSAEKRLEFPNTVQFRKSATEEYPASGWVTVTPISYNPKTVMMFGKETHQHMATEALLKQVVESPEKFRTCSSWPAPEVNIVRTELANG